MKKSKIFAIANLVMTAVIIGLIVFALTFEPNARQAHLDSIADENQRLSEGIGTVFIVIVMVLAVGIYAISATVLGVSGLGLLLSGRTGFLIAGAVGKFIAVLPLFLMEISTVSAFSRGLYIAVALLYLGGGIVDIVFREKIKA